MDFNEILKPGLEAQALDVVTEKNVAATWHSGALAVYSTPAMIGLMEAASCNAIDNLLPAGWTSVGVDVRIKHLAATPLGMKVTAQAELLLVDDRALSFKVTAFDEAGMIGEGVHGRFLVENEKFLAKVKNKALKN